MTKFFIGVVVGIFFGASVGAYGDVLTKSRTSSTWTVIKVSEAARFTSTVTATRRVDRE